MGFSFLHVADIHLGRAFSDVPVSDEKMDTCNSAGEFAFNKIVEVAIEKKVDFVLIAGDSFDNEDYDLSAKLIFIRGLKKLADNGIKSYTICGNHDPIEMYEKQKSYFKFGSEYDGIINITGVTTDNFCHKYSTGEITIHSLSFKTEEGENPVNYLDNADKNCFNIGLIHCDLDKNNSKYAPCSREDLRKLGYDYYALGHIHIPEVKEEGVVYSGSPQARTRKETGEHGCYYVCVDDKKIKNLEFIPVDFVRFNTVEINCSDCENIMEVFEKTTEYVDSIDDDILNLIEIELTGVTKAYSDIILCDNLTKEYNTNYNNDSKNKEVYRINNHCEPYVEESEIEDSDGVLGIIARSFGENSEVDIDKIYDDIAKLHTNIYKKLKLDDESEKALLTSLETDREEILKSVNQELKFLCSEIYNLER